MRLVPCRLHLGVMRELKLPHDVTKRHRVPGEARTNRCIRRQTVRTRRRFPDSRGELCAPRRLGGALPVGDDNFVNFKVESVLWSYDVLPSRAGVDAGPADLSRPRGGMARWDSVAKLHVAKARSCRDRDDRNAPREFVAIARQRRGLAGLLCG
jgi:hypothetical protein